MKRKLTTTISIGICAYNEETNIGNILSNLLSQPLLPNQELIEIIVVSSGCTDGTVDVVRRYCERDARVNLIVEKKRNGKTHAQNIILREARGDVLVMMSADVHPERGSLALLANDIKGDVGAADSLVLLLNRTKGLRNFIPHFTWSLHNRTMAHEDAKGTLMHLAGNMFAIKNRIIRHIPVNVINDDAYIGMAIRKMGYRVMYEQKSIVYIMGPRTIPDYIRQRRRVLYGHRQLLKMLGNYPNTLEMMIFKNPLESFKIIFGELTKRPFKDYLKIVCSILLEALANIISVFDCFLGKDHRLWKTVPSTKNLRLQR
ncbi:MAG: glycosyltransferase [Candidatus Geothermarchaeales archaeon]